MRNVTIPGAAILVLAFSAGVAHGQTYVALHSFAGADGFIPACGLLQAADGNFYGTTVAGGTNSQGNVFRMDASGNVVTLHSFDGTDGAQPKAGLIQATDGNFYGTTTIGGPTGHIGTVFRMNAAGTVTTLHEFLGSDGGSPMGVLLQASDGNLYGTTVVGGSAPMGQVAAGTVFKITLAGDFTSLHTFVSADGTGPVAGLIQTADNGLWGTTTGGGANGYGTVFKITTGGSFNVVHSFIQTGSAPEGSHGPLLLAKDGYLYGTTFKGGANGQGTGGFGTVFKMSTLGIYETLHDFAGGAGGRIPTTGLIQATDGNFYGITSEGGASGLGIIFRMDASGNLTPLHSFALSTGGQTSATPISGNLIQAKNRNLYGTAPLGGASNFGVVFRIHSTTTGTTEGDFDGDGKADNTIFRPSTGTWYSAQSSTQLTTYTARGWGVSGDVPVAGDYDGDGKFDFAVYRPSTGTWWILFSGANYTTYGSYNWGASGDLPVTADYDGDGRADIAIYRPSAGVWWILKSSTNYATYSSYTWGASGDTPVPADFDGDGKADIAIFRPSTGVWWILKSTTNYASYSSYVWGASDDTPVPVEIDGDGKADIAIYRPSTGIWWILKSSTNYASYSSYGWGAISDTPVPADFDGDGRADIAIFRPSSGDWWTLWSGTNYTTFSAYSWGVSGDVPIRNIRQ